MAALIVAAAILHPWHAPTGGDVARGLATYADPGVFEGVAAYRALDTRGYTGLVALNPAGDLGRVVWLERAGVFEGPFLVVDCARATDYATRVDAHLVIEVDWPTAERWGMRGPEAVTVHFRRPRMASYAIVKVLHPV